MKIFFSFGSGNLTSLVVPAAAVGALGYGYMWWKVTGYPSHVFAYYLVLYLFVYFCSVY